jgi:hypothetical protein
MGRGSRTVNPARPRITVARAHGLPAQCVDAREKSSEGGCASNAVRAEPFPALASRRLRGEIFELPSGHIAPARKAVWAMLRPGADRSGAVGLPRASRYSVPSLEA